MTTTVHAGRQAQWRAAAAPRTPVLHLGAGSSWSLPGPAVSVRAEACGATSESNPGPLPPIPQGPGLDRRIGTGKNVAWGSLP
jgi:hypothetical protein